MHRLPMWMVTGLTVAILAVIGLWGLNNFILQSFWYGNAGALQQSLVREVVTVAVHQPETQLMVHQYMKEYLQTPEGQQMLESLLESPQVQAAILKQLDTPEVEQAFVNMLTKPKNREKVIEAMKGSADFKWFFELQKALTVPGGE